MRCSCHTGTVCGHPRFSMIIRCLATSFELARAVLFLLRNDRMKPGSAGTALPHSADRHDWYLVYLVCLGEEDPGAQGFLDSHGQVKLAPVAPSRLSIRDWGAVAPQTTYATCMSSSVSKSSSAPPGAHSCPMARQPMMAAIVIVRLKEKTAPCQWYPTPLSIAEMVSSIALRVQQTWESLSSCPSDISLWRFAICSDQARRG